MPFAKKAHQPDSPLSTPARSVFVGRTNELLFFVQHILKPEEPTHNILSIWGQGGVGKTTLLQQFRNQTATADFRAYCLTAFVDERQAAPASMMEKFAHQLHLGKPFEKALQRYREALQFLPHSKSPSSLQETIVAKAPDIAGALVEGAVPVAGPLLREGVKATTEHLLDHHQPTKGHSAVVKFNDPLETLTQVFLAELNHLAATKIMISSTRTKRERRILLFFDTFEQVADEAVPWLLHTVLEMEINPNIVFIVAGRDAIERSTADGPKQWLPYYESHTLYALPVQPFTHQETTAYLAERGITGSERIETIWQLSHGLPLYLGLLATNTQAALDPTKDVVDNFLRRIPDSEPTKRQLALDAALFSKPFNLDDLEAFSYLTDQDRPVLYKWLLRQPFIRASSLGGRYLYHDLAQELFQRYLFQHSPKNYQATRKTLAAYYQRVLEYILTVQERNRYGPSDERLAVMLALASQRFFLPDEESHLQALSPLLDIYEYEDIEQVQTVHRMLRKTVEILSNIQAGSHAHQVVQTSLRFFETFPTPWDRTYKQAWLTATNQLLELVKYTSSPELLAHTYDACASGYRRFGEYEQALTSYECALKLHPHSARIQNGLGFSYYYLKEYRQALDHFNYGVELTPHHPGLYLGRGRVYGMLKDYQQALNDFDHVLQLDPKIYLAYNNRARISMDVKEYRKSLADLDHILEVVPREHPIASRTQFRKGCAHLWLRDLAQARACFTRSFELAPTQDFFLWVKEWSMMGQTPPDLQMLHHLAVIADKDHYTGHVCRGVLFFLQKEFTQALTILQHATTLHYDDYWHADFWADFWQDWDAHFWLGMTYLALEQEEEAHMAIEQTLASGMPPILLKPLSWFEQEKPKFYEQLVKPLFDTYDV